MKRVAVQSVPISRIFLALAIFIFVLGAISFSASGFMKKGAHFLPATRSQASNHRGQLLFYRSIGRVPQNSGSPAFTPKTNLLTKSYTLDIDSSPSMDLAEESLQKLSKLHVQAYYTPLQRDGRVVYRIRSGIYRSKVMADQASIKLLKDQGISSKVNTLQ